MYPINLCVRGLPCLVIGGGHVAWRKVRRLIGEGAFVTVLSPEAVGEIDRLAKEGKLRRKESEFADGDCAGYRLVITAAGIRDVAEKVRRASVETGFLYNAADFPELGNCSLPAVFSSGGIQIAVSTDGRSPAMARYVKEWLQGEMPDAFGLWLDRVSAIREELKRQEGSSRERECFWRQALGPAVMRLVAEGKIDEAEECVRHAIGGMGAES